MMSETLTNDDRHESAIRKRCADCQREYDVTDARWVRCVRCQARLARFRPHLSEPPVVVAPWSKHHEPS